MKTLVLMMGVSGSGKSTLIEKMGWQNYTISPDSLRLMMAGLESAPDGSQFISQKANKQVWDLVHSMLETRMKKGLFTVLDSTCCSQKTVSKLRQIAKDNRYRVFVIDMMKTRTVEQSKEGNLSRDEVKVVPESVVDHQFEAYQQLQIPSAWTVLTADQAHEVYMKPDDYSRYESIQIIGDIHGCYTALMTSLGELDENTLYIFVGDYLDRGVENAETLEWLLEHKDDKNIIFLEGNHERHLKHWVTDGAGFGREFNQVTLPELEAAKISTKEVKRFLQRLRQCAWFIFDGKEYLVTHGGLSDWRNILTPTRELIHGTGEYEDMEECAAVFAQRHPDIIQIHGHRNVNEQESQYLPHHFVLEDKVEFGGHLRSVILTHYGISVQEVRNPVFKTAEMIDAENLVQAIEGMRKSSYINEKEFGHISSFNFSKEAFYKGVWNSLTTKARGLFINTHTNQIVARSYDKFFNVGEKPETTLESLKQNLQFPVTAYVKENGFLGIVGYDPESDELVITSKSTMVGDFAGYVRNCLELCGGEHIFEKLKDILKNSGITLVFEVCDKENDRHLIEYDETKIVLLDMIRNDLRFSKYPYEDVVEIAGKLNLPCKQQAFVFENWNELEQVLNDRLEYGYEFDGRPVEGFVMEDSAGFMFKVKTAYYTFWKQMRSEMVRIRKSGKLKGRFGSLGNDFLAWYQEQEQSPDDHVIDFREKFLKEYVK